MKEKDVSFVVRIPVKVCECTIKRPDDITDKEWAKMATDLQEVIDEMENG